MANLVLLLVCFLAGVLMRVSGKMDVASSRPLNTFLVYVSLPALTLRYVHGFRLSAEMGFMAAMPFISFGIGVVFFSIAGSLLKIPRLTLGALLLTGSLGNTSFFGLPMIEAFYGKEFLHYGIIIDQLGSFMVLSIFGIYYASAFSLDDTQQRSIATTLRRIVLFPSFIAMVLALSLSGVSYPEWFQSVITRLGDTLVPLAIFSVGLQFSISNISGYYLYLVLGLGFKLLLMPASMFVLYYGILRTGGDATKITLFESAMPPMITAGIIANQYGLDAKMANLMVTIGLLISVISLSFWALVI